MKESLILERWSFAQYLRALNMQSNHSLSISEIVKNKNCKFEPITVASLLKEFVGRDFVNKSGITRNVRYNITDKLISISDFNEFQKLFTSSVSQKKKSITHKTDMERDIHLFIDNHQKLVKRNEVLEKSNAILSKRVKEMEKTINNLYNLLLPYLNKGK